MTVTPRDEARACGFTRPAIRRRIVGGTWEEVAPRVYRIVAALPIDWRQLLLALTLASGGLAAGESAAALYDLLSAPARHEIVLHRRPYVELDALVRTTSELPTIDRTRVGCIPATNPTRTIIDLAAAGWQIYRLIIIGSVARYVKPCSSRCGAGAKRRRSPAIERPRAGYPGSQ